LFPVKSKSTKGPAIKEKMISVQTTIDLLTEPATETTESTEQRQQIRKLLKL
jgi:hypothetical protein